MPKIQNIVDRLGARVMSAEDSVDLAIASVAELTAEICRARVEARGEEGVTAATGQVELIRLGDVQARLTRAGSDVLRVHEAMVAVQRQAAPDTHPICDEKAIVGTFFGVADHRSAAKTAH